MQKLVAVTKSRYGKLSVLVIFALMMYFQPYVLFQLFIIMFFLCVYVCKIFSKLDLTPPPVVATGSGPSLRGGRLSWVEEEKEEERREKKKREEQTTRSNRMLYQLQQKVECGCNNRNSTAIYFP